MAATEPTQPAGVTLALVSHTNVGKTTLARTTGSTCSTMPCWV